MERFIHLVFIKHLPEVYEHAVRNADRIFLKLKIDYKIYHSYLILQKTLKIVPFVIQLSIIHFPQC